MTGLIGCLSLLLDIGILALGVWVLAKGSLPAPLLNPLLGKGECRTNARTARLFGSLLAVPFVGLVLAVVSTEAANEQVAILVSTFHLIVLLVVILIGVMWARQIRNTANALR